MTTTAGDPVTDAVVGSDPVSDRQAQTRRHARPGGVAPQRDRLERQHR
jgi:hypothetical protein